MRLAEDEARARLAAHDHGILCTVHAERGVDAVPVAYVVDEDGYVGVPVDRVKPKASSRLQRERNLEADPRATLLVEHWDRDDWSRLWWVRAELRWQGDAAAGRAAALAARLAGRYPQYRDQPFDRVLVLRIVGVAGWAAGSQLIPAVSRRRCQRRRRGEQPLGLGTDRAAHSNRRLTSSVSARSTPRSRVRERRCAVDGEGELVDVAPPPVFARLVGLYDRVAAVVEVGGGVLVG